MIQQKLNELPTNASLFPSTLKEKQNKINLKFIYILYLAINTNSVICLQLWANHYFSKNLSLFILNKKVELNDF